MRLVVSLVAVATLFCGLGLTVVVLAVDNYQDPGPLMRNATVVVPKGAGVGAIAAELAKKGVVSNPVMFQLAARFKKTDKKLKAGEYAFPAHVSPREVLEILESGKTVSHSVTLAEGLSTAQMLDVIAKTENLVGEVGGPPPEGALMPETYFFSKGDARKDVVERMRRDMEEAVYEVWALREKDHPLKSARDFLILASIVEKETGKPEERGRVAAVFLNRLGLGMRLQSDPTVVYGITQGAGPLGRGLTRKELRQATPYNTYLIAGLPPGPICNPGRAALEATAHPEKTDELYFVADGTGGHAFAKTLAEHNRNVAKWRKIERERKKGGK